MRAQVFPIAGGRWEVRFPDPTEAELATVGLSCEELGPDGPDFATSGEARRAAKKVVRGMHALTARVDVEVLDYEPDDEGT